jgi:hypothetical protein
MTNDDIVISRRYEHARVANLLLGLWLIASTYIWSHFELSRYNTRLVGALVASSALLALRKPFLRWANAVLGVWLLISIFLIRPVQPATWWNNLLVAIAVLGSALLSHRGPATIIGSAPSASGERRVDDHRLSLDAKHRSGARQPRADIPTTGAKAVPERPLPKQEEDTDATRAR